MQMMMTAMITPLLSGGEDAQEQGQQWWENEGAWGQVQGEMRSAVQHAAAWRDVVSEKTFSQWRLTYFRVAKTDCTAIWPTKTGSQN